MINPLLPSLHPSRSPSLPDDYSGSDAYGASRDPYSDPYGGDGGGMGGGGRRGGEGMGGGMGGGGGRAPRGSEHTGVIKMRGLPYSANVRVGVIGNKKL